MNEDITETGWFNDRTEEKTNPQQECVACGYVLAGVGLVIGVVFLYMSIDVLSGGKLTQILGLGGKVVDDE